MMQKILKNEKGSISLFVLLSALFFLVVVTSVGVSLKNKEASIDAQFEKTKLSYEKDVGNEEQVYNEESKKHTVTFNANGGSANITSKVVREGEEYGELPTPTREGYTFKGWNGKNSSIEINEDNYSVYHYSNRTSHEFRNEENNIFVRIFGNESESNTDTSWYIKDKIQKIDPGNYCLSFYVRSKNSLTTQYIAKRTGTSNGKTGIYHDDNTNLSSNSMVSTIENNLNFNNDGEWHRVESKINISNHIADGIIIIGNDVPNIYGPGSYIDISKIQFEEGSIATEYETYYITPNTKVTQDKDHTLTAIWEAN